MKTIYTLAATLAIISSATAQDKETVPGSSTPQGTAAAATGSGPSISPAHRDAVDTILQRLRDEPAEFRDMLKDQLIALGAEAARYVLWRAPLLDKECMVWAFATLASMKDAKFDDELRHLLRSPHPDLRAGAVRLLAERRCKGAFSQILDLLRDKEPVVRIAAVVSLERLGDERSLSAVADMAGDSDEGTRRAALGSATEMARTFAKEPELARRLIPFGLSTSEAVRADIAEALGRLVATTSTALLPMEEVRATLTRLLNDSRSGVRARAALALGEVRGSQRELLARLGSEREDAVKASLCQALGRVGQSEAIAPLIDHLRSPSEDVQRNAADALRQITKQTGLGRDYAAWRRWLQGAR